MDNLIDGNVKLAIRLVVLSRKAHVGHFIHRAAASNNELNL